MVIKVKEIIYMKRIITTMTMVALLGVGPVFAQDNGAIAAPTGVKMEEKRELRKAAPQFDATQIACIKAAITKREDALAGGFTTLSSAISTAYGARKAALLVAWDKPTTAERRVAVRAADRAFDQSTKAARKTWGETRRATWKTFETDRKACLPATTTSVSASDTGSSKSDTAL